MHNSRLGNYFAIFGRTWRLNAAHFDRRQSAKLGRKFEELEGAGGGELEMISCKYVK